MFAKIVKHDYIVQHEKRIHAKEVRKNVSKLVGSPEVSSHSLPVLHDNGVLQYMLFWFL